MATGVSHPAILDSIRIASRNAVDRPTTSPLPVLRRRAGLVSHCRCPRVGSVVHARGVPTRRHPKIPESRGTIGESSGGGGGRTESSPDVRQERAARDSSAAGVAWAGAGWGETNVRPSRSPKALGVADFLGFLAEPGL